MKIKMIKTSDGSVDGAKVLTYEVGKEYELSHTAGARALAKSFVESECAKQVGPDDAVDNEEIAVADVAATAVPMNIAPPDQISTSVHPGDIEAVPSRAVRPTAAAIDAKANHLVEEVGEKAAAKHDDKSAQAPANKAAATPKKK